MSILLLFSIVLPLLWSINSYLFWAIDNQFLATLLLNCICFVLFANNISDTLWFIFTYLTIVIHAKSPEVMPYLVLAKLMLYLLNDGYQNTKPFRSMIEIAIISLIFAPSLSLVTLCSIASLIHNIIINRDRSEDVVNSSIMIWYIPIVFQFILLVCDYNVFLIFDLMNTMGFFTLWDMAFFVSYHLHIIN
jgi:hypothetical protein